MPRQSISFTAPNDQWLKAQVESEEYTSKSEVINDLIRRAREHETIRTKLMASEHSGIAAQSADEMLAEFKRDAGL